ncbi:hypothetical protein [Gorillibacterium sp. sgz500922]|uniref:hypothetical protein n=1 Tax=Gorillibacterium sp. sgz500922 TaxID=3446694 RepID=UPI003F6691F4
MSSLNRIIAYLDQYAFTEEELKTMLAAYLLQADSGDVLAYLEAARHLFDVPNIDPDALREALEEMQGEPTGLEPATRL